jgi:putative flavoprotein involved in K+ transport
MSDKTPSQRAQDWLSGFELAMSQGQVAQATAMFDTDCYWRDLVSFTWNICTQEGRSAIQDLLQARLGDVKPAHFVLEGEATEAEGVVDAWFTFETAVARGRRPGLDAADHHDRTQRL